MEQKEAEVGPPVGAERELVVFRVRRDAHCSDCGTELSKGSLLRREGEGVLCLECSDLDELEYLPSGDAALTRRARKYSTLQAVVVEWSRSRQRYERQGVLVEAKALEQAEVECLADAEVRMRRRARAAIQRDEQDQAYIVQFAAAVRSAYPGCPADEAERIATHACRRSSGRIGRTAAARSLDAQAIHLAVAAHVRHVHTNYDHLLARMIDRGQARLQIADQVDHVLNRWSSSRPIIN